MPSHRTHWGAALALLAGLAQGAWADSVSVTLSGVSDYRVFKASLDGGSTYQSALAGTLHWTAGENNAGLPPVFDTFCIELTQHVGYGRYAYQTIPLEHGPSPGGADVVDGMGAAKADLLRELWGRHRNDVIDSDTSAAFQLAIWEIVYDQFLNDDGALDLPRSLDLKDGGFRVKDAIASQPYLSTAQDWLWELDGTGPKAHLMALSSARQQDQVFEAPMPVDAPLPSAAWGGLGLVTGLVAFSARRRLAGH